MGGGRLMRRGDDLGKHKQGFGRLILLTQRFLSLALFLPPSLSSRPFLFISTRCSSQLVSRLSFSPQDQLKRAAYRPPRLEFGRLIKQKGHSNGVLERRTVIRR